MGVFNLLEIFRNYSKKNKKTRLIHISTDQVYDGKGFFSEKNINLSNYYAFSKYIGELKEDFRIKNNIDPDKHMARLNYLGQVAEDNKMVGVALRAEELRGKVAGYYIDKQIIKSVDSIDNLSTEELQQKMKQILEDNRHFIEGKKDE